MKKNILITLLVAVVSFGLGNISQISFGLENQPASQATPDKADAPANPDSTDNFWNFNKNPKADLNTFWKVWDILEKEYFETEDLKNEQKRIYGAIKGMVNALGDPYTLFMTPEETKEFEQSLEGQLEGIGAELSIEDGNLVVVSPIKGTPAERAGLKPGDIIYKINDQETGDMTLFEAISKIRGPKGTGVKLTIIRRSASEPLEFTIIRENINVPSVETEYKDNIAIVSINQFNDQAMPDFRKARGEILLKKPEGLIIDLRYNGGGYLDTAVELLSEYFDEKQKAVIIKQRDQEKNEIIYTSGNGKLADIPLVVIINEGSASASEIFAGAIQDHKRGLVIGEKSYGKGSVQEIQELDDGSSIRITIAKWFTPNDRSIDEVGILPDRVIALSEEDSKNQKDTQLDEAISYIKGLFK